MTREGSKIESVSYRLLVGRVAKDLSESSEVILLQLDIYAEYSRKKIF